MHDVIVVGAGFAGLSAAQALRAQGVENIAVLEARDRVGGRVKAGTLAGLSIDLGGMWLGPSQRRFRQLVQRYDLNTYSTFLDGKGVYSLAGKTVQGEREDFSGLFSIPEGLRYLLADRQLKKWVKACDPNAPWDHPDAEKLDNMTVETWIARALPTKRLRALFQLICFSVFCAEAAQISMLFFVHYLKSGEGLDILISSDEGGAQNFLVEGGTFRLAERMADELGDALHLNTPVSALRYEPQSVEIVAADRSFHARKVIIALPATLIPELLFSPPLPTCKRILHERLVMGSAIKYWVAYETPFWREAGLNGTIVDDQHAASPCFDVSPPNAEMGVLAGFFDGDHALRAGDDGPEARKETVLRMLSAHFGPKAMEALDYQEQNWVNTRWSRGCYGAFAPPGVYARYGPHLRQSIGPIHWAGTETATEWTGYIEGALQSGTRAADEVVASLS